MKISKRILSFVLTLCLLVSITPVTFADSVEVKVKVDEKYIDFDVKPCLIGGRTMVPLRAIFEALGATVVWDDATKTVTSYNEVYIVKCTIGKNEMYVNNEVEMMDVAPMEIEGRTLVPARFVAEAFDCKVDWDVDTFTVSIKSNDIDYSKVEQPATQIPIDVNTETLDVQRGTLQNPYGSSEGVPVVYQEWSNDAAKKISIKCTNVIRGSKANSLANSENSFNDKPNDSQEWCFLEFDVKYISSTGSGDSLLKGSDIIYKDTFFTTEGSKLNVSDMATLGSKYKGYGVFDTEFYPGSSGKVVIGVLIPKNAGDILLRVPDKTTGIPKWINCTEGVKSTTSSKVTNTSSNSSLYNCYSGTNIPTYTEITGIALTRTDNLSDGTKYYVYPYTKKGEYYESVDYIGYFIKAGWTDLNADNNNTNYYTMSYANLSTGERILVMVDFKTKEVYVVPGN